MIEGTNGTNELSTKNPDGVYIIRPGVLVTLRSSVQGGVYYDREEMAVDQDAGGAESGGSTRVWKTTQRVPDPEEYARAKRVRGRAVSAIWNRSVKTVYGLICTDDDKPALDEAIKKAMDEVQAFNAGAKHTKVTLNVLRPRLVLGETSEAIAAETSEAVDALDASVESGDVQAIRKAANEAAEISRLLDGGLRERIVQKVKAAREAATAAAAAAREPEKAAAREKAKAEKEAKAQKRRDEQAERKAEREKKMQERAEARASREASAKERGEGANKERPAKLTPEQRLAKAQDRARNLAEKAEKAKRDAEEKARKAAEARAKREEKAAKAAEKAPNRDAGSEKLE